MNEVDLKIEKLCNKLEYIVKYGNNITINKECAFWGNNIYTVSSNALCDDIFTITFVADRRAYFIKADFNDSSNDLGIAVNMNNENAKKLMEIVKDKYENLQDKEKIEKIDESLEIIDRINDRIFKEV